MLGEIQKPHIFRPLTLGTKRSSALKCSPLCSSFMDVRLTILQVDNVPNEWLEMHWQVSRRLHLLNFDWTLRTVRVGLGRILHRCLFDQDLSVLYFPRDSWVLLRSEKAHVLTSSAVPHHLRALRYSVFGLATFIGLLGLALTFAWFFQCTPFLSNFVWSINATSCVNYDIFRWSRHRSTPSLLPKLNSIVWIGLSVPIDLLILAVPLRILHRTRMPEGEKRILKLVFSANLLGTLSW
jgi:hypothetical protein